MPELGLDHVVIGVADLEAAATGFGQVLGRRRSWRGRHPLYGTANILFRLENAYLELLALDPDAAETTPWTAGLARFLEENGDGIYAVAFSSADIAESVAALRERGLPIEDPAAGEGVDLETGAMRRWSNARIPLEATGGARCFVIEHRSPADALLPAAPTVSEDAAVADIAAVGIESTEIAAARGLWRDTFALAEAALAGGWRYDLGNAGLALRREEGGSVEGPPHRWSLIVLQIGNLAAARERLGVDFEEAHFFGAPGLLLTMSGAGLFLTGRA